MSRVSQARNLGKYFLLIDNMLVVLGFFRRLPAHLYSLCRSNGGGLP
ncbi:multidrug resistance protein MdtH [Salmonella enterica subsp. enterica]|nr:multidrug resistance protein MdtH [Salmonella enterica subsp. enterica]